MPASDPPESAGRPATGPEPAGTGAQLPEAIPTRPGDVELPAEPSPTELPATEPSLGTRAARSAAISLATQGGRILIQTASTAILARLLTPTDYGLLALVVAVVGVGEILRDFGLSSAAIQARTLSTQQRDNLFWINTGIGAVLTAICLAGAPLAGSLFDDDRLVPVMQGLAIIFLLNGLAAQYRAGLVRQMRFRALAVVDLVAPLVALIAAIVIAVAGGGASALVMQQVLTMAVGLVLAAVMARWLPGLPHRGVPMRGFISFGGWLFGSQVITYLAKNIDNFVNFRAFGADAAGLYSRPFQLLMTPLNQVRSPATQVALPALSQVQDDRERFNEYVKAGQLALALPLTVVLAVIVGAAGPVVDVFLGDKWTQSVPILQFLALAGLFQTLAFVGYWVYLARALTNSLMYYSIVAAILKIVCVLVGSHWGLNGVAAGYAVSHLLEWPLSLWWLGRVTTVPGRALYAGAGRLIALGLPVGLAAYGMTVWTASLPSFVQLVAAAVAGLAVAAGFSAAVPASRRDLALIIRIGRLALNRKGSS